MSISGGNLQECIERQTEYIGNDLNIANNGIRNKVYVIRNRILIESFKSRTNTNIYDLLSNSILQRRREGRKIANEVVRTHLDVTIGCM